MIVTRDNYDLGVNAEDTVRETMRGVLAANGTVSDHLRYEASYVYGETRSRIVELRNRYEDRWLAAIDVVTDPDTGSAGVPLVARSGRDPALAGCVPYNIFGTHAAAIPARPIG